MLGAARTWPLLGTPAEVPVRGALVASCCVTFPCSKRAELESRWEDYLQWHTAWHTLPNVAALTWLSSMAFLRRGRR